MQIPTVRVRAGDSYRIINESDFDPGMHVRWVEESVGSAPDGNLLKAAAEGAEIPGTVEEMPGELGEAIQEAPFELPPVKRGWPKGKPRKIQA
jgi:hypothetical protein